MWKNAGKRKLSLVLLIMFASLTVSNAGSAELVIAIASEPFGTDVQQVTTALNLIHGLIGTPPISLGLNNNEILPWGAETVQVAEDGLTIRLTFDPNRLFHNGQPVTAEAVRRSIERYIEISPYAFDYDPVIDMVVEDNTLTLYLEEAGPALLVVLASVYAAPVEVRAAEEMGEQEFDRRAISDGPFIVEEWIDGSHMTFVRHDVYYDYLPIVNNNQAFHFERIRVRFIPEGFTRVSELRTGNVHIITDVPSELLSILQTDDSVTLYEYLSPNVRHLQMNTARLPFDDYAVRLAVALALDRDEIMQGVAGTIRPLYSLVSEAMISHDPQTEADLREKFAHNLEQANRLLDEAGWSKGNDGVRSRDGRRLSFTLAISGDNPIDRRAGPIIQAQLERVGMVVDLREYDSRFIRQLIEEADFDMVLRNWNWLDPGGVWPAGLRTGGRLAPWSHPEVDVLLDAAVVEPDPDKRAQKWGQVSRRVWQDVPLIPMWSDRAFVATHAHLEGLLMSVSGTMYLHDMKLRSE